MMEENKKIESEIKRKKQSQKNKQKQKSKSEKDRYFSYYDDIKVGSHKVVDW